MKFTPPGTWTEYIGPGDDRIVWKRVVTLSGTDAKGQRAALSMHQQNVYRTGERRTTEEHWFSAPMHSNAVELQSDHPGRYPANGDTWWQLCSMCRGGSDPDLFVPALQWSDGTPGHFTNPYENGKYFLTTKTRLFNGATEIPAENRDNPFAFYPVFRLAPEPGTYRLETTDVQPAGAAIGAANGALFRLAPRVDTTWTFQSRRSMNTPPRGYFCHEGGSACSFQPLIQIRHRFPLDSGNQAPAAGPYTFTLEAASHVGAPTGKPVLLVAMSYSTDDGATWQQAVVVPQGNGRWAVTAAHPELAATNGYVWLRTEARDGAGNTVTQTMQRAYALTTRSTVGRESVRIR